jgi:branched-chain amino acid transport system permease protein
MEQTGTNFLNAISYGMILFLIASGLSLILGVMGILNLAHGSLYLLGAYVGLTIVPHVGNFWLAAILAGLFVGVVGIIMERGLLSRLHRQTNEQALLTLGIVYIASNVFLWIWGAYQRMGTAPSWLSGSISTGAFSFPVYRFAIVVIGLVIFAGLWWFQEKTRAGAIVRAGMDDKEMTTGLGINYALVCSAIFFLGAFVGGVCGFLATPWLGAGHEMAFPILLLALISVVIGGIGTVQGTLLGAMVVGLVDSFSKALIPQFALFTPYIVFIIILMFKPTGLLGRKQ